MVIAYFGGAGAFGGKNLTPPTVNIGSYTYNGSAQGPTVTGLDAKKMYVQNATAVEPGNYQLRVVLRNKKTMTWADTKNSEDKVYNYTIDKIVISDPSVSNTELTYTGGSIGPSISYNGTYAVASGTTMATNAGDYSFSISLKDATHYRWSSGDSNAKSYSWKISVNYFPAVCNVYNASYSAEDGVKKGSFIQTVQPNGSASFHVGAVVDGSRNYIMVDLVNNSDYSIKGPISGWFVLSNKDTKGDPDDPYGLIYTVYSHSTISLVGTIAPAAGYPSSHSVITIPSTGGYEKTTFTIDISA